MKIAYLLGEYPSLTETFIAREIAALRRRGFEVDIWAQRAGVGARALPSLSSIQCLAKPWRHVWPAARAMYWRHLGAHWAHVEAAQLQGVDHIHAGWASHPAYIAQGAAQTLGVPWSFSGHARDLWVEGDDLSAKLHDAKFAACCTRTGAAWLSDQSPVHTSKVLYIPHGLELAHFPFRERSTPSQPVRILAVGRLVEKKGYIDLLQAIAQLAAQRSLEVTIMGEGPQREVLETLIGQCHLQNSVQLMGAVSANEVAEAMKRADLFVMSSVEAGDGDRDGLPNVLLEAAASGLPIVSTRAGSITDFLGESSATLCAAGDASALAKALEQAVDNYVDGLSRAQEARYIVEKQFDIEKNIEALAAAFLK